MFHLNPAVHNCHVAVVETFCGMVTQPVLHHTHSVSCHYKSGFHWVHCSVVTHSFI